MVETKKLAEFTAEERQKLLLDVYEVYKKHGVEKKLGSPQLVDQLITDIASKPKSFERELIFQAKGILKADQSALATKISEDVN